MPKDFKFKKEKHQYDKKEKENIRTPGSFQ
jgi:hypothetical protein